MSICVVVLWHDPCNLGLLLLIFRNEFPPMAWTFMIQKAISQQFHQQYSTLYNIRGHFQDKPADSLTAKINAYIEEIALPSLSSEETSLEEEFTVEEVGQTIKAFPLGKSPGPDGFNNKFYKTFGDLLSPFMCKVFNSTSHSSPFAPQSLEAYISVLPKPGKDPTSCSNVCPISLINVDVKIFSKMIA